MSQPFFWRALEASKHFLCGVAIIAVAGCNLGSGSTTSGSSSTLTSVGATLSITGTPPTQALATQVYSFSPNVSAPADTTVSFSIQNKPSWATFSTVDGSLTGDPATSDAGTYSDIVISVSDSQKTASLAAFAIVVSAMAPPTVSLSANPSTVDSGSASTLTWSTMGASTCTASDGWSGNQSLSGSVSTGALGVTTQYTLTCTSSDGASTARTATVAVATAPPAGGAGLQIATTTLPSATVGQAYTATLAATGGSGSGYTYNMVSATPDSDLWMYVTPNGTLGGTPENAETETVTYQVTDSAGNTARGTFSLVASTSGSLNVISPTTLPNAVNDGFYSYRLLIQGGQPPYMCQWTSAQPWTVTPDCIIEGTPTSAGTVNFPAITVTDAAKNAVIYSPSLTVSSSSNPVLASIDSVSGFLNLPPAWAGQKYSVQVHAYGGTGTGYSYSASGLPAWATLSATGILSGTPTVSGNILPTIQVTDSSGKTGSVSALMNISSSAQVSRPSYNSSASNGFFVLSGQIYDPSGFPVRIAGMDRTHFDSASWASGANGAATGVNSVRVFNSIYDTPTLADSMNHAVTDYVSNGILPILTMGTIPTFLGVGSVSGNTLTITSVLWGSLAVGNTIPIEALPFGTTITAMGTGSGGAGTYTLSSAGTVSTQSIVAMVSTGGLSGDTSLTDLSNAVNLWVSMEPVYAPYMGKIMINIANEWGGYAGSPVTYTQWQAAYESAVAELRAAGYTCPIVIDILQYGQDFQTFFGGYAQAVFNSDPLKNTIFSVHLYNNTSSYSYITNIASGSTTTVTVNSKAAINPFVYDSAIGQYFDGNVYFQGVQGMTEINGQIAKVVSTGGLPGAWTATVNLNTSGYGSYTGGGMMLDENTSLARAQILNGVEKSQGLPIVVGEFGPPGLLNSDNTMDGTGRFIGYMESYGIPDYAWSWDDGSNEWSENQAFPITLGGGVYATDAPSGLTEFGMDVVLNPRSGIGASDVRADALQ